MEFLGVLIGRLAVSVLAAVLAGSALHGAQVDVPQVHEHDLKAVFLYNFTRFVEWPSGIPPGSEPFHLCVVADAVTTTAVEKAMEGELVNGRASRVLVPKTVTDAPTCQILFIGRTEMTRAAPLLAAVRDSPVLTVSDADHFAVRGGTIEFVHEQGRVRFDVNVESARRAGLEISSRLLQVARRVEGRTR